MADTNEMINLPMVSVAPVGDAPVASEYDVADITLDPTITIGSPKSSHGAECVTVWADNITPSSCNDESVAAFDVVFSVGIRSEDGMTSKTYRVVKRIGIDKCKIAAEAESSSPVSIVEQKVVDDAKATAKRFRRLAGLE